jgi:hypothetical protein
MALQIGSFTPKLECLGDVFRQRCELVQKELSTRGNRFVDATFIEYLRRTFLVPLASPSPEQLAEELQLITALSVLIDLVAQGWSIRETTPEVVLEFESEATQEAEKERIRRAHLMDRDSQVREPSVIAFIRGMEKRRLTPNGWHSVLSLMRDGRELATKLENVLALDSEEKQLEALRLVIDPYIQFVDSEALCEHTGIRLNDIWRYFRHTWVNSYKSVPGRLMMILVRDAAAPNHPVIGIASLASAVVQQSVRDKWIGWEPAKVIERLKPLAPKRATSMLLKQLASLSRGLYIKDLLADKIVTREDLKKPTDVAIKKLLRESERAIKQHRLYPHAAKHKQEVQGKKNDWRVRAETSLFRSKRCKILATLLSIRKTFLECGLSLKHPQNLRSAYDSGRFRVAVGQLFRLIKGERVGIKMMDIMVCGSVAPYNILLGGKLVCYLLCSPEIVKHYAARYGGQTSLIASGMGGRIVTRPAQLVLLCTTSLYGSALSQYSRVKVTTNEIGGSGSEKIEFENLGLSEGFGVFHFSRETLRLMNMLLARCKESRKVNSIFGEGVNPLMRKIREALSMLGLPADVLLKHGNKRVVYGVALARNFREVLLGLSDKPHYLVPQTKARTRTEALSEYWRKRWLLKRLYKDGILAQVAEHTLVYPIRHGAQVQIPTDLEPVISVWT